MMHPTKPTPPPTAKRKRAATKSANKFAYDAIATTNKRASVAPLNRSEDLELRPQERAKLLATGRDLHRNFALLGWAIRKHLDYVSTFEFQAKGNERAAMALEAFIQDWSKRERFDVARRHNLRSFVRLCEMRAMVDGDIFALKLKNPQLPQIHGKIQAIEGDLIRDPLNYTPGAEIPQTIHGVATDPWGAATAYAYHRRAEKTWLNTAGNFTFDRMLRARDVYHHAYFDRFDQTRGISPLSPVYNALRDLYEGFDYALAKMKISQLLGLIIYSDAAESVGEIEENPSPTEETDDFGRPVTDGPRYRVKFGKDPFKLELDGRDRAEFIESRSPSTEFQSFSQTMTALTLKALDIPYSFYAENFSNYSGSRQALLQYDQSADTRREHVRNMLDHLTAWRIRLALEDKDPRFEGLRFSDFQWEWVSTALPWIDPLKEVTANAAAVDRGFTSTPRVCKARAVDAFDIAKEQADFEKRVGDYRESLGLPRIPNANPINYVELAQTTTPNTGDQPAP